MDPFAQISLLSAFLAGVLSFVSPCVLPLVPSYLSYITGLSFEELEKESSRQRVAWVTAKSTLIFIAGFSTVFIAFGASATALGHLFLTYQEAIRQLGGILIIFFGLYMMGTLKLPWLSWLSIDKHWRFTERPAGNIGTFLIGVAFAAGWTPCVGPILGAILLKASGTNSVGAGVELLTVYSIGLGLPLFIAAIAFNSFLVAWKSLQRHMRAVTIVSGGFLIFIGFLIFTNSFTVLTAYLTKHGIGWYVGQ